MNTRFLETLVWLTRLRSFSRAAEKLNASQPAISNRIAKLEETLGVKLYNRNTRQFELTPAGRRILRHAEEIVNLAAELQELAESDEEADTVLRIGVIEAVTMSWLPIFINRVTTAYPKAILELSTGTSLELTQQLRAGELDIAFIAGPVNEPAILSRPMCSIEIGWVAAPSRFRCDSELDVVELSQLPILMPSPGSSGYTILVEYFRTFGIVDIPHPSRKLVIDCIYSLGTALELARSGLGVTAIPLFLLRDDVKSGRLAQMKVRQTLPPFHIVACSSYPATSHMVSRMADEAAAAVLEFVRDHDAPGMSAT